LGRYIEVCRLERRNGSGKKEMDLPKPVLPEMDQPKEVFWPKDVPGPSLKPSKYSHPPFTPCPQFRFVHDGIKSKFTVINWFV